MTEESSGLTERGRELRRREWLTIYLPLIIGAVLLLALVVTISIEGFKKANLGTDPASAWGDTAAIIVMIQIAAISLFPLAILIALCALVIWLIDRVPPVLMQGQEFTEQVRNRVDGVADRLVTATIKPYLMGARVRAIARLGDGLRSER